MILSVAISSKDAAAKGWGSSSLAPSLSLLFRLDLIEELLDTDLFLEGIVVVEGQFGDSSQVVQSLSQGATSIAGSRFQTLQDFLSFLGATERTDKHAGVPQIRRHLNVRHGHQPDTRILNLAFEDFA